MNGRLDGKIAIVTGGASGIGLAVARRFAAEGGRIVVVDLAPEAGEALAVELGGEARFFRGDVTEEATWAAATAAADALGGLDILVNNVGGSPYVRGIENQTLAEHQRIMALNLDSAWLGIRAAAPLMRRRGGGAIVNISSIDGLVGIASLSSYVSAKFAVTGLTRSAALELGADGIRVNSVHPGVVDTPMVRGATPEALERTRASLADQPIPRMGRPEEIAAAALFLASDESSYCTGSALVVDGGHIAGPVRRRVD